MPPSILFDLSTLDLEKVIYDRSQIEEINPHRFEMQHLDGIIHLDHEQGIVVGYKEVTAGPPGNATSSVFVPTGCEIAWFTTSLFGFTADSAYHIR